MQVFFPEKMEGRDSYHLLVDCIVPRPIALISTLSKEGKGNLAPFSFFNGVSSQPPALVISISHNSRGDSKDTLRNILETREFVVNSVSKSIAHQAHQTSANYPYGVDEMTKVGLNPLPSVKVGPPRVKESPIQMECRLIQTIPVGKRVEGGATLVIGEIVLFHIAEEILDQGRVNFKKLQPIARLGGPSYSELGNTFDLQRAHLKTDTTG